MAKTYNYYTNPKTGNTAKVVAGSKADQRYSSLGQAAAYKPKERYSFTNKEGSRVTGFTNNTKTITPLAKPPAATGQAKYETSPALTDLSINMYNKQNGITSSNSVLDSSRSQQAVNNAGAALVTNPPNPYAVNPYQSATMNTIQQQTMQGIGSINNMQQTYMQGAQAALGAQKLVFNSALASQNLQYAQLQDELQSNYQNSIEVATANALSLNPYSQARGAQTAANFNNSITQKYNQQALNLQRQADAANRALEAQNYQAYIEISNGMKNANAAFQQQMFEFVVQQQRAMEQVRQFDMGFALDMSRFNLDVDKFQFQKDTQSYQDYMGMVETFNLDPVMQGELNNYFSTGKMTPALEALAQKGVAAGMTPEEALDLARYQTLEGARFKESQRQFDAEMSLGWANYNLGATKLAMEMAEAAKGQDGTLSTNALEKTQNILQTADKAMKMISDGDFFTTGYGAAAAQWLPGRATSADTLQAFYDEMAAGIKLNEMQKIKDASATGSLGFGNQSNMEFMTLSDALGVLDATMDSQVQMRSVAEIVSSYYNLVKIDEYVRQGKSAKDVNPNEFMTPDKVINSYAISGAGTPFTSSSGRTYQLPN